MPKKGSGLGIKWWPSVNVKISPLQFQEWRQIADAKGYSLNELVREVLEKVGLPYARAVASKSTQSASVPAKAA